ncbi:histone deacetylase family protein [Lacihabitans soyangensis]|uniref:Histone deacetylase n=1 Tax=Lacihabitans soyangensis TaxID=869394 RepID=A0AAE3KS66_9BACT|nr:histone deacetylase [Lacihabitans soyangensis]MCP9762264.1 histone deacetylase [Lacihabitans soyangensis]
MIKIAFHPIYCHPLPEGHRFPMLKYELLPEQLLYEGTFKPENFFKPQKVEPEDVMRAHTLEYYNDLLSLSLSPKMIRKIGFPLTAELVERELIITQGTIDCSYFALENGISFNIAGGTHHAYSAAGEGFCLLNDVAVAAMKMLHDKKAKQVMVVDLDVHQGNGTAKIFENTPEVFTFSMHGKDNYPLQKEISDLDIPLPTGCADEQYLGLLQCHLPRLLAEVAPDFIYYVSGVDILETDKLGKLKVTLDGCKKRDEMVLEIAKRNNIPVVVVMGGGYSPKIADIVEAHANTFRVAESIF